MNLNKGDQRAPASSSSSSSSSAVVSPRKPLVRIEVHNSIIDKVKVWSASKICSEDHCADFPEGSKYIVFPGSKNFVVDRCTGYISIENRGDHDVTLVSREREPTTWEPFNVGARVAGSYVLRAHTQQGFDFRGYYCIEVSHKDIESHPVDLFVYEHASKGGGRGNHLNMW